MSGDIRTESPVLRATARAPVRRQRVTQRYPERFEVRCSKVMAAEIADLAVATGLPKLDLVRQVVRVGLRKTPRLWPSEAEAFIATLETLRTVALALEAEVRAEAHGDWSAETRQAVADLRLQISKCLSTLVARFDRAQQRSG